ncbi:MAG: hypothetical protein GC138_09700 [Gammaproteobacteria bacterium]|nr:hypothetical protein [Gammaproteobacteria bacterium]
MNFALRLCLSGLLVLLCADVHAVTGGSSDEIRPPSDGRGLTLVQLTDLALSKNPKTRLAWAAIRASDAGVALARAGYWPQIDATLNAQRSRALNFSGQPSSTQTRYGASVSLSYLLWDFGTRKGTLDQAEFDLAAAHLSQDQTVQDVLLEVEQIYYQVVGLQAVVEVNRQSLRDAETNRVAAEERRASGLATVGDVYQSEAARAGARLVLQQSEGQLAAAQGQLAVAVGQSPDSVLSLVPLALTGTVEMPAQGVAELLAEARHFVPNCWPPGRASRPPRPCSRPLAAAVCRRSISAPMPVIHKFAISATAPSSARS